MRVGKIPGASWSDLHEPVHGLVPAWDAMRADDGRRVFFVLWHAFPRDEPNDPTSYCRNAKHRITQSALDGSFIRFGTVSTLQGMEHCSSPGKNVVVFNSSYLTCSPAVDSAAVCDMCEEIGRQMKEYQRMHANADDDLALSLLAEVIADLELGKSTLRPKDKSE